jgi:hypothetical protein
MAEPRTKKTALDTLEAMRQEVVQKLDDKEIAHLLSADLLKAVLNEAWRLQLDDDAKQFEHATRDLVMDATDQTESKGRR